MAVEYQHACSPTVSIRDICRSRNSQLSASMFILLRTRSVIIFLPLLYTQNSLIRISAPNLRYMNSQLVHKHKAGSKARFNPWRVYEGHKARNNNFVNLIPLPSVRYLFHSLPLAFSLPWSKSSFATIQVRGRECLLFPLPCTFTTHSHSSYTTDHLQHCKCTRIPCTSHSFLLPAFDAWLTHFILPPFLSLLFLYLKVILRSIRINCTSQSTTTYLLVRHPCNNQPEQERRFTKKSKRTLMFLPEKENLFSPGLALLWFILHACWGVCIVGISGRRYM